MTKQSFFVHLEKNAVIKSAWFLKIKACQANNLPSNTLFLNKGDEGNAVEIVHSDFSKAVSKVTHDILQPGS